MRDTADVAWSFNIPATLPPADSYYTDVKKLYYCSAIERLTDEEERGGVVGRASWQPRSTVVLRDTGIARALIMCVQYSVYSELGNSAGAIALPLEYGQ